MNSTMPAATPPRSMLATSTPKITGASGGPLLGSRSARPDLLLLAGVLHPVDLADHLLEDTAVLHHGFVQILVHHDVAADGGARACGAGAPQGAALHIVPCH